MRQEIETRLTNLLVKIEVDHPSNFEEIVSFIIQDIKEAGKLDSFTDKEIANGLKKYLEI
jgi:hypothetical protein